MVSYAGMFSPNESIEEVSTPNVKFILLPVLLGTLALKLTSGDRLEIVKTAEMYFRDFLQRCKDYSIKGDLEIPALENGGEDQSGSESESGFSPRNVDMMAMARRRASKIQQFREQKEMENQMALLQKVSGWRILSPPSECGEQTSKSVSSYVVYATEVDDSHGDFHSG